MNGIASLAVALGVAAPAQSQLQTEGSITYTLSYQVYAPAGPVGAPWSVVTFVNAGGLVSPGQGALLRLTGTMSGTPGGFDPNVGMPSSSPQHWYPNQQGIPPGSSGTGGL